MSSTLGIKTDAVSQEFKSAQNNQKTPAVMGEQNATINQTAANVLNQSDRKPSAEPSQNRPVSSYQPAGGKLSSEFARKIAHWIKTGVPSSARIHYKDPSSSASSVDQSDSSKILPGNSPDLSYKEFLNRNTGSLNDLLAVAIPSAIFEWAYKDVSLKISQPVINSPYWDRKADILSPSEYKISGELLDNLLTCAKAAPRRRLLSIDGISPLLDQLQFKQKSLFSIFFSMKIRYPVGKEKPLVSKSWEPVLGHIPKCRVEASSIELDTDADECYCCGESFGLFLWSENCMECGNACCSGCLGVTKLPNYAQEVAVGKCCQPKVENERIDAWLKPLNDQEGRDKITETYLFVLKFLRADKRKGRELLFVELAHLFYKDDRPDMVLACMDLLSMDDKSKATFLLNFADKYEVGQRYDLAMRCIDQIIRTFPSKKEALSSVKGMLNEEYFINLLLMLYIKADLAPAEYAELPFPYNILSVTSRHCNQETVNNLIEQTIASKDYSLTAFILSRQNAPIDKWIQVINSLDEEAAWRFIHCMKDRVNCDWRKIRFKPEIDHLRWHIISPQAEFGVWLDYLVSLLRQTNGKHCIPYFKSCFQNENFEQRRDAYFADGEYTKGLICHRLLPDSRISWQELAQTYLSTNEAASLACYWCDSTPEANIGDQLFEEGKYSLALLYYLQSCDYVKIEERMQDAAPDVQLFYQFALWKFTPCQNFFMEICKTLDADPTKKPLLQNILIAKLKDTDDPYSIEYHKMLAETGITERELQGLLGVISHFDLSPADKKWYDTALRNMKVKFKVELRGATNQGSWNKLSSLLDRINLQTLSAVNILLKEINPDALASGTKKSISLVIRAVTHMHTPSESNMLDAMDDLTEAMLSDSSERCIQCCTRIVEEISSATKWALSFKQKRFTDVKFPQGIRFKGLQPTEETYRLLAAETHLKQLNPEPFAVSMMYMDITEKMANEAGLASGYINAATELLKALQSLDAANHPNEIYAYRRAIVELVEMGYSISQKNLSPCMQLYTVRSGIACLTAAFEKSKKISAEEQELLEDLYKETQRLYNIAPLIFSKTLTIYDSIFLNLVHSKFLKEYLTKQRSSPEGAKDPKYQYWIFEGIINRWLDQNEFNFEVERQKTMKSVLPKEGNSMEHVEELMDWKLVPLDSEGWYPQTGAKVNLLGQEYSSVVGIEFNQETGQVRRMVIEADSGEGIFDTSDVVQVMESGIQEAEFSLDPPNYAEMRFHPFQKKVSDPRLEGSDRVGTMLRADVILKEITTGVEISGKAPSFALRDADENLLQRLPAKLRSEIKAARKKLAGTAERAYRFWIHADKVEYYKEKSQDKVTYKFVDCKMTIKTHRMDRDLHTGKLQDIGNVDKNSPESKFAALLTDHYEVLEEHFPEFSRLKELVKMQAMLVFAKKVFVKALKTNPITAQLYAESYKAARIALRPESASAEPAFSLVPAAISLKNGFVYGGVTLNPQLSRLPSPPPSNPQTSADRPRARYVEGSTVKGRRVGTVTCIETISQSVYTSLRIAKPMGLGRSGYWASAIAPNIRDNVVHITHHDQVDTTHIHYPKKVVCLHANGGTVTYDPRKSKHKCADTKDERYG